MEYSLYGSMTYRAGTSDTPFLFNGRYGVMTDPNGLLFMRARYYNPFICRFINPDPSGFAGGLNMYAFANGNPVSYLDPFGLWTWGQVGSTALHFGEGVVVGAAITAAVIIAAPEIAAGLVAVGVSEAVATATVSGGLYVAGGYGAYKTVQNTAQNAGAATVTGDWDSVAFNVGTVVGGTIIGTTPGIVGESSGGRTLTDNLHELMGQPPSGAPNTWNLGDILGYELQNSYQPSLGAPGVNYWATAPTPFSSGFTATGIAGDLGTWITPSTGPSSPSSSSQSSSSTGK
jgi:RHS repeat-associated protein